MTEAAAIELSLSASTCLEPGLGEVIETVAGEVLVFVRAADGRRIPMMTMEPGGVIAGFDPAQDGCQLQITGLPGSAVRTHRLDEFIRHQGVAGLERWIFRLGQAAMQDRWVERVIAPGDEPLRLAPGECVSVTTDAIPSSDQSVLGWLRVTSGSARYCGWSGAEVGVLDPPVPMTRGVWLTSGLRCRISTGQVPKTPDDWARALQTIGRLGAQGVLASRRQSDGIREGRMLAGQARGLRQSQEGVDRLTGAVIGPILRPTEPADRGSSAVAAAFIAARAGGLVIDEESRSRAFQEAELGRDPITAAAQSCAARAREVDLSSTWWLSEGPPLVANRRSGGFVALVWRGSRWVAIDPANPTEQESVTPDFARHLEPKGTELVPILGPNQSNLGALVRLATSRASHEGRVIVILTLGIAGLAFFTPYIFGQIAGSFGSITMTGLVAPLLALILLLGVTTAWEIVRSLALLRLRVKATAIATGAIWDRMMRLRSTWHDGYNLGERMTQSSAVSNAGAQVPDSVIVGLLDSVAVLGSLAAVATTTSALLAAVTVLLCFQILISLWLVKVGAALMFDRVTASAQANGRLMETLQAVNRLRVSGAEDRAFRRWAQVHSRLTRADLALRKLMTIQGIVIGSWPLIGLLVIVYVSSASGATFSEFVTTQAAAGIASATIAAATLSAGAMLNGRAVLRKVIPVLEAVPEGFGEGVNPGTLSGQITFKDIVFRYEPTGRPVLDGVSFRVNPGEQVAIVGPSGSGKTTLMRILLGLEEPESGVIAVDGKDMASLDRPSVRRQIGCVLQSSTLLPGSIRDNIDLGRGLTTSQIWQALESASIADDVRNMGMGLDTPVVDGGGMISGGQRQRLLIARSLAGNPRMLVLDEATSALDNVTQGIVVEFLGNLRLTRIVIAHRLSTIRSADRIIVLAGGRVTQQGSYEELMAEPGHFRDLAQRQLS